MVLPYWNRKIRLCRDGTPQDCWPRWKLGRGKWMMSCYPAIERSMTTLMRCSKLYGTGLPLRRTLPLRRR